jgi:CRP-like cAMP-binding protein
MPLVSDLSNELSDTFQMVDIYKKVEKGTYLFQEGSSATELFFIHNGIIQLNKINPDGREFTLKICTTGDLIGESMLFSPNIKYSLNAKVIEDGKVAIISKEELEKKLSKNHDLALDFIKWMSIQQRKTQSKFRDLVLHGKKGALYSTLIRLSNSYGASTNKGIFINLPLTNQELANFCGTSREVVNRLLSELRKSKIISINKGFITIHDLEFLKIDINCENCPIEICGID